MSGVINARERFVRQGNGKRSALTGIFKGELDRVLKMAGRLRLGTMVFVIDGKGEMGFLSPPGQDDKKVALPMLNGVYAMLGRHGDWGDEFLSRLLSAAAKKRGMAEIREGVKAILDAIEAKMEEGK